MKYTFDCAASKKLYSYYLITDNNRFGTNEKSFFVSFATLVSEYFHGYFHSEDFSENVNFKKNFIMDKGRTTLQHGCHSTKQLIVVNCAAR